LSALPRRFNFRDKSLPAQWAAIVVLSLVLAAAMTALRLPAALLLASIGAAATISSFEGRAKISPRLFLLAQAVLGGMIAQFIKPDILREILRDWPLFVAAAVSVIVVSCLIGWALTRWRVFPDSTAIWGSLPGAASAMVLMADAYGADMRLVAFMQYFRVLLVALIASLVARFFTIGGAPPPASWFTTIQNPVHWPAFALTVLLLIACAWLGRRLRIPAGPLLLPLAICAALQDFGLFTLELPREFLGLSYAILGWSIGLRFSRDILLHAFKSLPVIFASTLLLLAICGGFGLVLGHYAHVDAMSAYLATSPGGLDAVAIIAASTKLDMPFVMALQTARILLVILIGPFLARKFADWSATSAAEIE
jgi:membrane AbrB-like protein